MASKLKVAICDDEPRAITIVSASVESVFQALNEDISLETFLSPGELLARLRNRAFDLIFLDISMPKKDGIALGKELKQYGSTAELVFVSSRMDRMFDTFAVRPFGFVRIHKGYLASARYIRRFDSRTVTLTTGEELPIGRSRHHEAMDEYLQYVGQSSASFPAE